VKSTSTAAAPSPSSASPALGQYSPVVSQRPKPLSAPAEYSVTLPESDFCADRFSTRYLEKLRNASGQYCMTDARSSLTCFHSHTGDVADSMCIGHNAVFDTSSNKFLLDCPMRPLSAEEHSRGAVDYDAIRQYWYDTGPRWILDQAVDLTAGDRVPQPKERKSKAVTMIVKREGPYHLWHCLMEIFSMTLTFDALRMARDPASPMGAAFFDKEKQSPDTQVVFIDDGPDGPFFDLWSVITGRKPIRAKDLTATLAASAAGSTRIPLDSVIIPLAGAANTLWENDWTVRDCSSSALLDTFVARIRGFYSLPPPPPPALTRINLTFINRTTTRKLQDQQRLLDVVQKKYHPYVQVNVVDFAALDFKEQIKVAAETDVLVGVHGAGLTLAMFMKGGHEGGGAVVEVLPPKMYHKGFRNLAMMKGMGYFGAHGALVPKEKKQESAGKKEPEKKDGEKRSELLLPRENEKDDGAWHFADMAIEEQRFVELVGAAVMSVYNKGERNFDIN